MSKQNPASQETEEVKKPGEVVIPEEHKTADVEVELNPSSNKGDAAPDPTEKLRNQMFYEMRQQEKKILAAQERMLNEAIQRISGLNAQPQRGTEKLDDFDEEVERIAQVDWRKAVDMRAERIAERKLEEKLKAQEEKRKQDDYNQNAIRVEMRGRDKVLAEYPNIVDEASPEFRAYMEIFNREVAEDPMFLNNPRKHEIILPELREKLGAKQERVDPEIERLKRVAAGSATPTRPNTKSETITLTQDEINLCKRSGISVQAYARQKKAGLSGLKDGVVIDE